MSQSAFFASQHIQIFNVAKAASSGPGNLDQNNESKYRQFYLNLKEHHDLYFEQLFPHAEFHHLGNSACEILSTLATLYNDVHDLQKIVDVLPVYSKVVDVYRANVLNHYLKDEDIKASMEEATYTYDIIVTNVYIDLNRKELCLPSLRRAVLYELLNKSPLHRFHAQRITIGLGANNPKYSPLTVSKLNNISDDKIWKCFRKWKDSWLRGEDETSSWKKIKQCGGCGKPETTVGIFLRCSKCYEAAYCSKECQIQHWRNGHKNECQKVHKKVSKDGMVNGMKDGKKKGKKKGKRS